MEASPGLLRTATLPLCTHWQGLLADIKPSPGVGMTPWSSVSEDFTFLHGPLHGARLVQGSTFSRFQLRELPTGDPQPRPERQGHLLVAAGDFLRVPATGPWSLTLLLLLLFLLLQLAFLDTAQLGLADAPSLADGLKQSSPATGGVNYLLRSALNRGCKDKGEGLPRFTGWGKAAMPKATSGSGTWKCMSSTGKRSC